MRSDRSHASTVKLALVAAVLAALIGLLGSSVWLEAWPSFAGAATSPERTAVQAVADEPLSAVVSSPLARGKAPLGREELRYADKLWSVHVQVEQTIVRVGLGAALFKSRDIDRDQLRVRLDQGMANYRTAETQLRALDPPPRLRPLHDDYLTAIRLCQQSAQEMLRMYDDGDEEHLALGLPLSLDATIKLRTISSQFWPETFPRG
ncbi:MAG TPA: hypothetical protein VFG86_25405 [Chloroflexota bacterium]|nr:hypothetical protein [Chloroflexota bacterium]